jgi:hypothetical protein
LIFLPYQIRIPSDSSSQSSTPVPQERPSTSDTSDSESEVGFGSIPNRPEFEVNPVTATIMPFSKQKITVDFTSFHVKRYEAVIVVDVDGVGRDMLELPIKADCRTPKVHISQSITLPLLCCTIFSPPCLVIFSVQLFVYFTYYSWDCLPAFWISANVS